MITVNQIQHIEDDRNKLKKETYQLIYDKLSRKIRNAVQIKQSDVILSVPRVYIGQPLYDVHKATKYIIRQFKRGGFIITNINMYDCSFNVSWPRLKKNRLPIESRIQESPDEFDLTSLANLKKIANNMRKE